MLGCNNLFLFTIYKLKVKNSQSFGKIFMSKILQISRVLLLCQIIYYTTPC